MSKKEVSQNEFVYSVRWELGECLFKHFVDAENFKQEVCAVNKASNAQISARMLMTSSPIGGVALAA